MMKQKHGQDKSTSSSRELEATSRGYLHCRHNLAISFNAETVELYVCHIASCKEEKHPIVFCM